MMERPNTKLGLQINCFLFGVIVLFASCIKHSKSDSNSDSEVLVCVLDYISNIEHLNDGAIFISVGKGFSDSTSYVEMKVVRDKNSLMVERGYSAKYSGRDIILVYSSLLGSNNIDDNSPKLLENLISWNPYNNHLSSDVNDVEPLIDHYTLRFELSDLDNDLIRHLESDNRELPDKFFECFIN